MKRTRFQEREKIITTDLNALHEITEEAIKEVIEAISGGKDTLLFDNEPPTAVLVPGVDLTISVPEQRFSVLGVPGEVPATNFVLPDPPPSSSYKIFFLVGRTEVSANRDRLVLSPLGVVSELMVVKDEPVSRIELTTGGPPVVGPSELGYVELASVDLVGANWVVTHNITAVYAFPGTGPSYANHASRHVDPTDDPIQYADMTGRVGLMPPNSYPFLAESLQDLIVSSSSPYLVRTIAPAINSPGHPRTVTLEMRTSPSFVVDVSGPMLALNFPAPGTYAGDSNKPARWNHRHTPEESPVVVMSRRITVGSSDLDALLAEIEFTGVARILSAQVFWAKLGTHSPEHPAVACSVMGISEHGTVGASAVIVGNNKVRVQTGDVAFASMNASTVLLIGGGSVTWAYNTVLGPGYPTEGELFVRIVGMR